jgi:hypothetical protein
MTVKVYAVEQFRPGEWIAYEEHPVPGGQPMPLASSRSKETALTLAHAYLSSKPGGSVFKAERSVVGA